MAKLVRRVHLGYQFHSCGERHETCKFGKCKQGYRCMFKSTFSKEVQVRLAYVGDITSTTSKPQASTDLSTGSILIEELSKHFDRWSAFPETAFVDGLTLKGFPTQVCLSTRGTQRTCFELGKMQDRDPNSPSGYTTYRHAVSIWGPDVAICHCDLLQSDICFERYMTCMIDSKAVSHRYVFSTTACIWLVGHRMASISLRFSLERTFGKV